MFLLRRAAVRSVQSSAFLSKPRTLVTKTPSVLRSQQQWQVSSVFQRRFLSTDDIKEKAEETVEQVKSTVTDAYESVKETAQNVTESVKDTTQDATESVKETTENATESVKESSNDAVEKVQEKTTEAAAAVASAKAITLDTNTSVYVGNLFFNTTTEDVREMFGQKGEVVDARVITDGDGRSKGFAFVQFRNAEDAKTAVQELDQQMFKGRAMNVQHHQPRERAARAGPPVNDAQPSKTLFVGNMSFQMTDKDLNNLFKGIKNLLDVRVAIDRATGQPRGFAHADFIDVESAVAAREQLAEQEVFGRKLKVNYAMPAAHKADGGSGFGGRGGQRNDRNGGRPQGGNRQRY